MSNVVTFRGETKLDIPVRKVLAGAEDLQEVIVIGRRSDGELHFASSNSDLAWTLVHLELCREWTMQLIKNLPYPKAAE